MTTPTCNPSQSFYLVLEASFQSSLTSHDITSPTSVVVRAPATGPAREPGSAGAGGRVFATWVGPGFKVLLPRWVQFAKKWRHNLPVTRVPGLPWNPGLGLGARALAPLVRLLYRRQQHQRQCSFERKVLQWSISSELRWKGTQERANCEVLHKRSAEQCQLACWYYDCQNLQRAPLCLVRQRSAAFELSGRRASVGHLCSKGNGISSISGDAKTRTGQYAHRASQRQARSESAQQLNKKSWSLFWAMRTSQPKIPRSHLLLVLVLIVPVLRAEDGPVEKVLSRDQSATGCTFWLPWSLDTATSLV